MWNFIFRNNRFFIRRKKTDFNTKNNIFDSCNAGKIQLNDSHNEIDSSSLPFAESETELNKLVSSHDSESLYLIFRMYRIEKLTL